MLVRKGYKHILKHEAAQPNANQKTIQGLNQMQYACKISANSLYGVNEKYLSMTSVSNGNDVWMMSSTQNESKKVNYSTLVKGDPPEGKPQ